MLSDYNIQKVYSRIPLHFRQQALEDGRMYDIQKESTLHQQD
jgi:hypothetical protein